MTIPASSFWSLQSALDNVTTTNSVSYPLYILSNEVNKHVVYKELVGRSFTGNCFLGVGGLQCLNILHAALSKPKCRDQSVKLKHLVVVDISNIVKSFWQDINSLFRGCEDPQQFLCSLKNLLDKKQHYLFSLTTTKSEKVITFIKKACEWLSQVEAFEKIKKIFVKNRFAFVPLDLANAEDSLRLAVKLRALKLKVGLLYTSNIHEILPANLFIEFGKSIEALIKAGTPVITTKEKSYFLTKSMDAYDLLTAINYPFFSSRESLVPISREPVEQVLLNYQKLENLWSIFKTVDLIKSEYPNNQFFEIQATDHLFYRHGCEKGFYTDKEAEEIDRLIEKKYPQVTLETRSLICWLYKKGLRKSYEIQTFIPQKDAGCLSVGKKSTFTPIMLQILIILSIVYGLFLLNKIGGASQDISPA